MTPGLTPISFHPLGISQTSASNNTPTASYKQSLGESTATFEASHPLEISQTNASSNTPTANHEPSLGESATTPEASGHDKVQGGGAVFYVENDSSMTDVMASTEDQFEKLRRQSEVLVRRQSEAEENMQKIRQESTEHIQRLRAEIEEYRRNEIERILTEATDKHKEEMKQRLDKIEKENEKALKSTIDKTTRRVTSVTGKQLKANQQEIETLKAELAEREKQMKKLEEQVHTTHEQKEEIDSLKSILAQKETQMKEEFAKVNEEVLSAKETELKEQYAAQLRAKIAEHDEKVEADKRENEEQKNKELQAKELEIEKLQQQLDEIREKDETERLQAGIKQKDEKIRQLEEELKAERAKEKDQPQQSGAVSDDSHATQIEAVRTEMKAELQRLQEENIKELKLIKEAERTKLIEQHEKTVEELTVQIETERKRLFDAVTELKAQHKIEMQNARNAVIAEVQGQQKSQAKLYETAEYKQLSQHLKDKEDSLDSATATVTFLRDRLEKAEKDIRELQVENAQLMTNAQYDPPNGDFQHHEKYRQLQEKYEHLQEQYDQLKVVADLKREMPSPSSFESSVDPDDTVPVQKLALAPVSLLCMSAIGKLC